MTAQDYERHVSSPGKFEGEARYVPYFWDHIHFADEDNGKVATWRVTHEDTLQFPELKGRKYVHLMETDSGFVVEVGI